MSQDNKNALRQKMLIARQQWDGVDRQDANDKIFQSFQKLIKDQNVQNIAFYMPIKGEYDCQPLMMYMHEQGANVLLPVVRKNQRVLIFRKWSPEIQMVRGCFGILEPQPMAIEIQPDVIVVPGLAFDGNGNRLGYGGGYYDATMAKIKIEKDIKIMALCYGFQLLEKLICAPHDIPCDVIVTEQQVIKAK